MSENNSANSRVGSISLPVGRLHVEVTSHCNFSCEFCPDSRMERERGSMDIELLKGILDEVVMEKITGKVFFHVMGEPLLYPHLADAIGYATERGLYTSVTTNGSLLTDALLGDLMDAGVSNITLSLQTPDETTFGLRGARGIDFHDYKERVRDIARRLMDEGRTEFCISFLSSPLRRLIIPVMPEISIADTSKSLKAYLLNWAEYILRGTEYEADLGKVGKEIKRVGSFKENSIEIGPRVFFKTRIMGDWAVHSLNGGVKARIGFCPAIQENFGVLWNGDVVFCCVDFEGKTAVGNVRDMTLLECLKSRQMQEAARGFKRFRVLHPHCRRCMGDRNHLNAIVRQLGSIVYFKGWRKIFPRKGSDTNV
ncbi:MAG: radical SAM/SPASM domain-containing protein [Thermodesulfobacteriota bacterium]